MAEVGSKNFQNQAVRITDLAVVESVLVGYRFHNCSIHGPAVLIMQDSVQVISSRFDAPDFSALFWEIPPDREWVIGAIALIDCHFIECSFQGIGVAGPPESRKTMEAGFEKS